MRVTLTHRQQHVLWATVRHYIDTAEPVGSKALVDGYDLGVSPATIRNAMGALERSGLLFQPHTSAGRIPSDIGYRFYVDQLMQPSDELARQATVLLSDRLNGSRWSTEAILRGAAQILSTLSGYVALITLPQPQQVTLRHIQLVQIDVHQVMLVVVLDSLETYSTAINLPGESATADETPEAIAAEQLDRELQILSNFLNHHLRGRSLADITTLDWAEVDQEFRRYASLLSRSVQELEQRTRATGATQMLISGLAEVLRQPEFSETQQFQTLLQLLEEEQEQVSALIFTQPEADELPRRRTTVRIGSENPLEPIQTCALVSSTYYRGHQAVGSVGMLGPTRMIYDSAIPVVEAAADYLTTMLNAS